MCVRACVPVFVVKIDSITRISNPCFPFVTFYFCFIYRFRSLSTISWVLTFWFCHTHYLSVSLSLCLSPIVCFSFPHIFHNTFSFILLCVPTSSIVCVKSTIILVFFKATYYFMFPYLIRYPIVTILLCVDTLFLNVIFYL